MSWIVNKMKLLMLVFGALTCTTLYAAIAPQAALRSTFGTTLEGPLAEIVVRNWGALIGLVGVMLVYGAYNTSHRSMILAVAGLSKLIYIGLVLTYGRQYLGQQVGLAMVIDLIAVVVFFVYLIGSRPLHLSQRTV